MTRAGALLGVVADGVTVVGSNQLSGGLFEFYEMIPGVTASTVAVVVGSLLAPAPSTNLEECHEVMVNDLRARGF